MASKTTLAKFARNCAAWFTERRVLLAIDKDGYNVAACALSWNWEIIKNAYFEAICWIDVGYKIRLRRSSQVTLAETTDGIFIPTQKVSK